MNGKKINVMLIAFLAVAVLGIGYQYGVNKADKKGVEAIEEVYQEKIDNLANQLEGKNKELLALDVKIAGFEEDLQGLRNELSIIIIDNSAMKEKLREAPPEHLVTEARRIIDTEEIWLAGERVKFSISAFRDNTIILSEWEVFSLKVIPNLHGTINKQIGEIAAFKAKDLVWEGKEKLWEEHIETMDRINDAWKDYIKRNQRRSIFDTALKIGGGVLLGFFIGSVLGD